MKQSIIELMQKAEVLCAPAFLHAQAVEQKNLAKVMAAFSKEKVSARHFAPTTGYGYDDVGRQGLETIFATVFGAEKALVRPQFVSGTHALCVCLFGLLRTGDELLSAAGAPYDTMEEVIGLRGEGQGSLKEMGVTYQQVELMDDGGVDLDGVLSAIHTRTRVVLLQRSRGYAFRPSLSIERIKEITRAIHEKSSQTIVMVDNCYGEFTQDQEPTQVGVDIMAGSLIKNPGGGLAPTGGYIAGRKDLVDLAAYRLIAPGIGGEVGSYAGGYQAFYQGLFMAPHTVCQALMGAHLACALFSQLGYAVSPQIGQTRSDIIQAIEFGKKETLIAFCQAIQSASPVDAHVTPEPWAMPGYEHPVIMAAGTFVQGASIELSADAPIKPPFIGYLQGGLTYAHVRYALGIVLEHLQEEVLS